jgi:tripartite-type tricarboxylate transporter receptor subunit TctC
VTEKIQKAIQTALADPQLSERLKALDIQADYQPSAVLGKRVVSDVKNWSAFIASAGLKGQ